MRNPPSSRAQHLHNLWFGEMFFNGIFSVTDCLLQFWSLLVSPFPSIFPYPLFHRLLPLLPSPPTTWNELPVAVWHPKALLALSSIWCLRSCFSAGIGSASVYGSPRDTAYILFDSLLFSYFSFVNLFLDNLWDDPDEQTPSLSWFIIFHLPVSVASL